MNRVVWKVNNISLMDTIDTFSSVFKSTPCHHQCADFEAIQVWLLACIISFDISEFSDFSQPLSELQHVTWSLNIWPYRLLKMVLFLSDWLTAEQNPTQRLNYFFHAGEIAGWRSEALQCPCQVWSDQWTRQASPKGYYNLTPLTIHHISFPWKCVSWPVTNFYCKSCYFFIWFLFT